VGEFAKWPRRYKSALDLSDSCFFFLGFVPLSFERCDIAIRINATFQRK
jgi:hypothetical protein